MADDVPMVGAALTPARDEADPITAMLMRAATDPNFDPQKFEVAVKFLIDREEKANLRAYNRAFGRAMSNIHAVGRDGKNTRINYKYATLDAMLKVILPACHPEGLYPRFGTQPASIPGWMCVTCIVSHDDGHETIVAMESAIQTTEGVRGGQMAMNDMQAIGSTATYLKRYALAMQFTLILEDEQDDDGEANGKGGRKPPTSRPPRDVKPDTARAAAKYPKIFAQLQTVPSLERLDNFKSHPKFTAWWDAEAKIAAANGRLIDDMLYARRLELEAIAENERVVAEARAKTAAAQTKPEEPASSDPDLAIDEPAKPAELSAAALELLARINSCQTGVALDSLLTAPEFSRPFSALPIAEGDQLNVALKQRYLEVLRT